MLTKTSAGTSRGDTLGARGYGTRASKAIRANPWLAQMINEFGLIW